MSSAIILTVIFHPSWPSWFTQVGTRISFIFLLFVAAYFVGAGFYVMIRTAVLVHNISKLPLKISIYQHPTTSVKAIGHMFLRFSFCVIVAYSLWVFALLCSPLNKYLTDPVILFWVVPFGLVVLLYFIIPQYKIHEIMIKEKHKKIRKFSTHLDEAMELVTNDPTTKNINRLRELFEIQQQLNGMEDWPFNMKSIIFLLSAIFIPLLAIVINIIFG